MSPLPRPTPVPRPLDGLAAGAGAALEGDADARVTGVTLDSRDVRAGDLFAALPGEHAHGASFAVEAVARGATAILTDPAGLAASLAAQPRAILVHASPRSVLGGLASAVYGDPSADLLVLGVTGTNGKTTVAHLLEGGLRAGGHRTGLIGTTGVLIDGDIDGDDDGDDDDSLSISRTTPEAPDLHALLAVMRERGVTAVAMEVSSHALVLGRVDGIRFDVAAFTHLSQDHLDFHGTMEDYFAAKARLFEPRLSERAAIGIDDDWGRRLAGEVRIPATTFGLAPDADVHATMATPSDAEAAAGALQALDVAGAAPGRIALALPGEFNARNALAAWTVLDLAGIPAPAAAAGLAAVRVPGRMEVVDLGQPFRVVVDYAHSPDAVRRALESLAPGPGARRIVVLGCGGDRDREKRPHMGSVAAACADLVFVTDDNPRSEDPAAIRAALRSGTAGGTAEVHEVADRREAIRRAIEVAAPGDIVFLLGKGHETGQEVAGVVTPFDDRVEAREVLREVVA